MSELIHALPSLSDVIRAHDLRAEKKLGQNFLLDLNLTDKIVRQAGDLADAHVIEIGPGPGGLTRSILLNNPKSVTAVEFDSRAVAALQDLKEASGGQLTIIHGDALQTDITSLVDTPRAIIANLPYNIATPLLVGWLQQIRGGENAFQSMTLMFQREVAERIVAAPETKAYGRLSVMSQWLCEARICFHVPPSAFMPPPKVTSTIVHFTPKILGDHAPSFSTMEKVVKVAFNQRRKMIRSSLKEYRELFDAAGLVETIRAENMHVEDFVKLAKLVETSNKT